jgi:hypothetical protein
MILEGTHIALRGELRYYLCMNRYGKRYRYAYLRRVDGNAVFSFSNFVQTSSVR